MCKCLSICALLITFACLGAEETPEWKKALEQKLALEANFDYQDMQLDEVLDVLSSVLRVSIILDTAALKENPPVSFKSKPNQSSLESVRQILSQSGMEHQIRDEAIFVYRKGTYPTDDAARPEVLTDADKVQLAKEIEKLGSQSFTVREEATQALARLGAAARTELEKAARTCTDAEAMTRLRALIAGSGLAASLKEKPEVSAFLQALDASPLALEFIDSPADEAFPYLAKQLKIEVSYDGGALPDKRVTLKMKEMKPANALRWLSRLSGTELTLLGNHLHIIKAK